MAGERDDRTVRDVEIRAAVEGDAPAMGRVMVTAFLAAHRGQLPGAAYRKRVEEWTPEVSARAWARILPGGRDRAERDVVLVAEQQAAGLVGLVSAGPAEGDPTGKVAEIGALYVLPAHQGRGIGGSLMRAAAAALAARGFRELRLDVLTANAAARAFYEAMGGRVMGRATVDEEGYALPVTVFAWPELSALVIGGTAGPAGPAS